MGYSTIISNLLCHNNFILNYFICDAYWWKSEYNMIIYLYEYNMIIYLYVIASINTGLLSLIQISLAALVTL